MTNICFLFTGLMGSGIKLRIPTPILYLHCICMKDLTPRSHPKISRGALQNTLKKIFQFEFSQLDKCMILKTIGTFQGLQSLPALVEFSWHLQDDMKYLDTSLQMTFPIIVYPSSPAIDEGNEWDPLQKVFPSTAFSCKYPLCWNIYICKKRRQ